MSASSRPRFLAKQTSWISRALAFAKLALEAKHRQSRPWADSGCRSVSDDQAFAQLYLCRGIAFKDHAIQDRVWSAVGQANLMTIMGVPAIFDDDVGLFLEDRDHILIGEYASLTVFNKCTESKGLRMLDSTTVHSIRIFRPFSIFSFLVCANSSRKMSFQVCSEIDLIFELRDDFLNSSSEKPIRQKCLKKRESRIWKAKSSYVKSKRCKYTAARSTCSHSCSEPRFSV